MRRPRLWRHGGIRVSFPKRMPPSVRWSPIMKRRAATRSTTASFPTRHCVKRRFRRSGQPKEGLVALEKSVRLDPRDPRSAIRLNHKALGFYFSREYEAAVEVAKRAIRSYPD